MATQNVNAYLLYAPQDGNGSVKLEYFADAACTQIWFPSPIAPGDSVSYTIAPGNGSAAFDFEALTFWAKNSDGSLVSNVARTFQQFKDGVAHFLGKPYVTNVDVHSKSSVAFTVTNLNTGNQTGFVSFQSTIEDKSRQALYTSTDPQIGLDKDG